MKVDLICTEYPPAPRRGIGTFVAAYTRGLLVAGHEVAAAEIVG
jgi:hypothetical protein